MIFRNRSASSHLAREILKSATKFDENTVNRMVQSNITYTVLTIVKIQNKNVSIEKSQVIGND